MNAETAPVHIFMAPGQRVDYGASGNPPPEPGDDYTYSFESDDTSIATVDFQEGTNAKSHPAKGTITGVAPGETTITITYTVKCRDCWFSESPTTDVPVTVIGLSSLEAELPSTPGAPAGRFSTSNRDLAYVPSAANDLMVVMQNAGSMTISAIGPTPKTATDKIRWEVERNPDDTIDSAVPDFADNENGKFTVTPSKPGNFRIVAYVNTYDNNTRYKNAELKVLRLAIIRITPQVADSYISVPNLSYTDNVLGTNRIRLDSTDAMKIQANVIVEGGGSNRMIGVDQVQLAFAGNVLLDDIVINYAVPTPTPPPPGNVVGVGREGQGLSFPLVDCNADFPTTADPADIDHKFTRFTSNTALLGNGPGGGQVVVLEAWDDPSVLIAIRHPTTINPWTTIRGGNNFRETLIAWTRGFDKNYVAIGSGDWRITFDGMNTPNGWQGQNAGVFLQGGTGNKKPLTFVNQMPATSFGLKVLGPSFKHSLQGLSNGGVVYSP